jgi:hypothetical protein
MAAREAGADVVCVIDAHMRFESDVIARGVSLVRDNGGLIAPFCHHNAACDFSGGHYAGARIVYKAKDGKARTALCGKWARDMKAGQRGCVMGACYLFPVSWYFDVGEPLNALAGWGCDEEALSIAAWLSGRTPFVYEGRVAHRWRERPPWNVMSADHAGVYASRMALIRAVVTDVSDRRDLEEWTRSAVPEGVPSTETAAGEKFRLALLNLPRKYRQWRAQVCEPDEIDGVQVPVSVPVDRDVERVAPRANPTIPLRGVQCPHCHAVHDPIKLRVDHTYRNGNRRHACQKCGNPFISRFSATV